MAKKTTGNNLSGLNLVLGLLRFGLRHPWSLLLVLATGLGSYAFEIMVARPGMLYLGEPQAVDAKNFNTWFRTFRNHGFIVGYSDLRGNPLWVEYAVKAVPDDAPSLKRPNHFETDWRSINRVSHDDYKKSGYDRGHMAPNYAMSHLYGTQGQMDSFVMTNVTPQKPKLNEQLWQRLEEVEINYFTHTFDKVWVITGPVFKGPVERMPSAWNVEIPNAFYKIYITEGSPHHDPQSLAFLMPQDVNGNEPLSQYVTSIDNIEAQTGLDFFKALDDKTEAPLEAAIHPEPWRLAEVSNLPSRYAAQSHPAKNKAQKAKNDSK